MSSTNYQVFARKYRPKTFADVLGQDHVMRTLSNAITQNRLAHAYLFVGPRGTGKTSTSRIFAKALNCPGGPSIDFDPEHPLCIEIAEGRNLDVLEIDGASNNSVEQIRSLRDNVHFAPSSGKFRIYYIDEVHMLTNQAFNALLKTLEEPPAHVKFIFATTEAHKILPTILSRCQRFDLRRIPAPLIAQHLLHIAGLENITLDPMAAHAIAVGADGGMRDAQSMLDQLVAFCGASIAEEDVLHIFGFTSYETVSTLAESILTSDTVAALQHLLSLTEQGKDLPRLLGDLLLHLRNVLVHRVEPDIAMRDLPEKMAASLARQADMVSNEKLISLIDQFVTVDGNMKWASNKRLYFEIGIIRAIQILGESNLSDVIIALRRSLDGSSPGPASAPRAIPADTTPRPTGSWRAALQQSEPQPPAPPPTAAAPTPPPAIPAAPPQPPVLVAPSAELWELIKADLIKQLPLQSGYAAEAQFISSSAGVFLVGVPEAHALAATSLERPNVKAALEALVEKHTGQSLRFKAEIRPELTPAILPEKTVSPAAPLAAPPASKPTKQAKAEDNEEAALAAAAQAARDEEFKKDPLIAEALRLFEARIVG